LAAALTRATFWREEERKSWQERQRARKREEWEGKKLRREILTGIEECPLVQIGEECQEIQCCRGTCIA